ncbi:phosphoenolpyruvate--protein phosphotransferase, partial [Bacteroides thetaiotaomicron]
MYQGIAASEGIGIGKAVLLVEPDLDFSGAVFAGTDAEKSRLSAAVAEFTQKTSALAETMKARVGEKQAEILTGQVMMI